MCKSLIICCENKNDSFKVARILNKLNYRLSHGGKYDNHLVDYYWNLIKDQKNKTMCFNFSENEGNILQFYESQFDKYKIIKFSECKEIIKKIKESEYAFKVNK